jgi:hypothetical protein
MWWMICWVTLGFGGTLIVLLLGGRNESAATYEWELLLTPADEAVLRASGGLTEAQFAELCSEFRAARLTEGQVAELRRVFIRR